MELRFELTEYDRAEVAVSLLKLRRKQRITRGGILQALSVLFFLSTILAVFGRQALLISSILLVLCNQYFSKTRPFVEAQKIIEIAANQRELTIIGNEQETKFLWENLYCAEEIDTVFLLLPKPNRYFIIPKRAFASRDELETFRLWSGLIKPLLTSPPIPEPQ